MHRWSLAALALGVPAAASGYSGVADVTLSWGETANPIAWSWRGQNALNVMSNDTLFHSLLGSNQVQYFNSDFATSSSCTAAVLGIDGGATGIAARKYGCRYQNGGGDFEFMRLPSPPTDVGPAGAQATGTLNFTDTTLTGVLQIGATTDELTGGTANSVGDGASAFNVRANDTASAYGNVWYGVSAGATLTVDLTGTFTPTTWEITGGTVRLSDPGFQCQQGGYGGSPGVLCDPFANLPGSYSADGSHLSFGEVVRVLPVGSEIREIQVWDATGTAAVTTLAGVRASLVVGQGGVLATASGEFRAGVGDGDLCTSKLRWDGQRITCGTLTAGALQVTGTATPVDTEPEPFTFTPVGTVPLGTVQTSNTVTITGIAAPARVTVTGGTYSIGCTAPFTSAASNIPEGSTVCVRHTSAATPGTDTVTTLNVGGITAAFTSTTIPADTDPDAFTFTDVTEVALASLVVSGPVIIGGINTAAPVSVADGEYSLGCSGAYTTAPGSVVAGQSICVRHTSAVTPLTPVSTTLTVGSVADTFTSTTAAPPPDTTPDAFVFTDQADVALSVTVTSDPVTITGIDSPAAVSVTGGTYSVGCTGSYTAAAGSISDDQTVCVRHTSAAGNAAAVTTILTVGGVSDGFTSTTIALVPPDTTPDPFTFTDQTGVATGVQVTSAPVTIGGITGPATVTVTDGTYAIGCGGAFVSTPGSINNGESVCVRHTSAATASTPVTTTLTVGGMSGSFTSTTAGAPPPDTTPAAFSFADQSGVAPGTLVTSAPVTITGIDAPAAVTVSGGSYAVDCAGAYGSAPGTIANGQQVCVRHTSAGTNGTVTSTTLTVGGVSGTFSSTTAAAAGGGGGGGGGGATDWWLLGALGVLAGARRRPS